MDFQTIRDKIAQFVELSWSSMLKHQSAVAGLDLNSSPARLLVLASNGNRFKINSFALAEIPSDPFNALEPKKDLEQAPVEPLLNALQGKKLTAHPVALAVPGFAVAINMVRMKKGMEDAEREVQAWVESGKYFPDLIDDMSLDLVIKGDNEQDPGQEDVLLVACRKGEVEARVKLAKASGFKVKIVDVEYYALARAYNLLLPQLIAQGENKTIAMLDLNSGTSTFIVMQNHQMIYSFAQPFGSEMVLRHVCECLEVKDLYLDLADKLPALTSEKIQAAKLLVQDQLMVHIHQSLQLFGSDPSHATLDQLVLSGTWALLPGLAELVEEQINTPTLIAQPFADMDMTEADSQALKHIAPAFTLCCGLALNGKWKNGY